MQAEVCYFQTVLRVSNVVIFKQNSYKVNKKLHNLVYCINNFTVPPESSAKNIETLDQISTTLNFVSSTPCSEKS